MIPNNLSTSCITTYKFIILQTVIDIAVGVEFLQRKEKIDRFCLTKGHLELVIQSRTLIVRKLSLVVFYFSHVSCGMIGINDIYSVKTLLRECHYLFIQKHIKCILASSFPLK